MKQAKCLLIFITKRRFHPVYSSCGPVVVGRPFYRAFAALLALCFGFWGFFFNEMERTDAPVHSRRPFHVDHIQASIFTDTRNCSVQKRICVKLIVIICVKNSDVQSVLCCKCLALISAERLVWPPSLSNTQTQTHTHFAAARWTWHRFSVTRPQLRGREGD